MRDVERVAVLVEAMRGAVGRQTGLQGDARHVEKIAHRVLILRPREASHSGAAFCVETRAIRFRSNSM